MTEERAELRHQTAVFELWELAFSVDGVLGAASVRHTAKLGTLFAGCQLLETVAAPLLDGHARLSLT